LSKFGFFGHKFGSSYAGKSVKDSKDANHSLVSKPNLSQKWLNGLTPKAR